MEGEGLGGGRESGGWRGWVRRRKRERRVEGEGLGGGRESGGGGVRRRKERRVEGVG